VLARAAPGLSIVNPRRLIFCWGLTFPTNLNSHAPNARKFSRACVRLKLAFGATSNPVGVMVILSVVFPVAHRTDLKSAALGQRLESAARAWVFDAGLRRLKDVHEWVQYIPPLPYTSTVQFSTAAIPGTRENALSLVTSTAWMAMAWAPIIVSSTERPVPALSSRTRKSP
jgi:hypothetical protein